jgi:hypothetical protein
VIDPWFQNEWPDRIDDNDCVVVLRCDRSDQRVTI